LIKPNHSIKTTTTIKVITAMASTSVMNSTSVMDLSQKYEVSFSTEVWVWYPNSSDEYDVFGKEKFTLVFYRKLYNLEHSYLYENFIVRMFRFNGEIYEQTLYSGIPHLEQQYRRTHGGSEKEAEAEAEERHNSEYEDSSTVMSKQQSNTFTIRLTRDMVENKYIVVNDLFPGRRPILYKTNLFKDLENIDQELEGMKNYKESFLEMVDTDLNACFTVVFETGVLICYSKTDKDDKDDKDDNRIQNEEREEGEEQEEGGDEFENGKVMLYKKMEDAEDYILENYLLRIKKENGEIYEEPFYSDAIVSEMNIFGKNSLLYK